MNVQEETEWRDVLLEDLAAPSRNALVGGPFGSDLVSSDYFPTGVPVIRGENLSLGRWVGGEFVFVTPQKAERLASNTAGPLDIVFTQRGANHYRQLAVVPPNVTQRFVISQSQMKITVDSEKADPLFVYYLFRSPEQQEYLQRHAIETGVPHTNLSILRKVPLRIPTLLKQRAIAHVLGTLDDKIELNRRMNETLEAMARAIFKSWFVDFDPVRAKNEGRDTGLPKHIADLFPDHFEDSELGEVPEGWIPASVGDETHLVKGISYRSEELAESETALVTLKSINRGGGYRPDGLKPFTGKFKKEQIISPGELVVAQTDVTQAAEVIGKPALVIPNSQFRILVASLDLLIVRPNKGDLSREFFYLMFLTPEFQDHIYGHTNGTTVLHLSKTGIPSYRFARPSQPLACAFANAIQPLLERLVQNEIAARTLATLRDMLLPKLISGEVRIPSTEKRVEGIA